MPPKQEEATGILCQGDRTGLTPGVSSILLDVAEYMGGQGRAESKVARVIGLHLRPGLWVVVLAIVIRRVAPSHHTGQEMEAMGRGMTSLSSVNQLMQNQA